MSVTLSNINQYDWTVEAGRAKEFKKKMGQQGTPHALVRQPFPNLQWVKGTLPAVKWPGRESGHIPIKC